MPNPTLPSPESEPRQHARVGTRRRPTSSRRLAPFLLACDESAVGELEAMVATLPMCASGRVFIEVASTADVGLVTVPSRMTVTWLPRSSRSGAPGTGTTCGRGEALARAVTAWADEMLCDGSDDARVVEVWLGGDYRGVAPVHEHLVEALGIDASRITAPARFNLA
jgi:NADPH-dependent ferric siderophore reductase